MCELLSSRHLVVHWLRVSRSVDAELDMATQTVMCSRGPNGTAEKL